MTSPVGAPHMASMHIYIEYREIVPHFENLLLLCTAVQSSKQERKCFSLTITSLSPTSAAFEGSALALPANLDAASSARSRACLPSSALKFLARLLRSSPYLFCTKDTFLLAVFLRELGFGRDSMTLRHNLDIAAVCVVGAGVSWGDGEAAESPGAPSVSPGHRNSDLISPDPGLDPVCIHRR